MSTLFVCRAGCDLPNEDPHQRDEVLERALAKVVEVGARVGVSPDQMIDLLNAGLTVGELLEYVLTLARNLPETGDKSSREGNATKSGQCGEIRVECQRGDCNA